MRRTKIKTAKAPKIILFVFVYFLLSCAFSIFVAVQMAVVGAGISEIEKNQEEVIAQNNLLNEEFLNFSSLTSVYEKANDMGFTEATKIVYSQDDNFAVKLP